MDSEDCIDDGLLPNTSHSVDREFVLRCQGSWITGSVNADLGTELGHSSAPKTRLKEIQDQLDAWKNSIHDLCIDEDDKRKWRLHTQRTHPLHLAPKVLREHYNCESTSQAFCKFLEILTRFPRLIEPSGSTFRSFHLCEAPGHFVGALDRFLCTYHGNLDWHWEANSLNPHDESVEACDMLLDDDLIVAHPEKWRFGQDYSGDITKWEGPYFRTIVGDGFDMVTADGSLYVQDAPGEQESKVLPLMQAEVNAALRLLRKGGCLILKMYSIFLPDTRRLIADVASRFQDVSVFKPMCSKAGNSERYLICKGFSSKEALRNQIKTGALLVKCEEFFSLLQGLAIKSNLESFNAVSKTELNEYKDKLMSIFLRKVLANYLAYPSRPTWLEYVKNGNPWKEMMGNNYVERLRNISTPEEARQFIQQEMQSEILSSGAFDGCQSGEIDVEWASDELDFLYDVDPDSPIQKAEMDRVLICGPSHSNIKHSLFTEPALLHASNQLAPTLLVDLCTGSSNELSAYCGHICKVISNDAGDQGILEIDAAKMNSKRDWLHLLKTLLDHLQDFAGIELVWSTKSSFPMILSRFSASVVTFLTIFYSKIHLKDGESLGLFTLPNYEEDLPTGIKPYLIEVLNRAALVHQFVPLHLLASVHPELVSFNRRQWSHLLPLIAQENMAMEH